ncbi:MAG: hypothetical protein ABL858_09680, partial [Candidatus Nitrotoga sp.]
LFFEFLEEFLSVVFFKKIAGNIEGETGNTFTVSLTRSREQQSCIKELTKEVERLNKIITDMHADRFLMLKEFQRVENGAAQKKYR